VLSNNELQTADPISDFDSSALKRDIYFMNLNNIDTDSELLSAFSSIPRKSVVVFEDIDAMTPVCTKAGLKKNF
jgi:RNA recognition motif-containing protein